MEGLQLLPHLAQGVLDLTRLIQNFHAAGEGVVANRKGPLDGCRVSPGQVKRQIQVTGDCWKLGLYPAATLLSRNTQIVPQLELCVLKTLGHKVNRLVGLVLIRLHGTLFGDERLVLRLIGQRVLDGHIGDPQQATGVCAS